MAQSFKDLADFTRWNEEMTRIYDSEDYHLRSNFVIRWIEQKRVKAAIELIAADETDTVLEVGCGAGVVLSQFSARQLIGIDLSGYILRKARRRLANRDAVLVQASAERLPLRGRQFNKVLCTEVIEHVMNPQILASELARLSGDDATVVITIPNEGLIDRLKNIINKLGLGKWLLTGTSESDAGDDAYDSPDGPNEWHLHHFDIDMLHEVVAGSLTVEEVKPIPYRFLPLRYVARCQPVRITSDETHKEDVIFSKS